MLFHRQYVKQLSCAYANNCAVGYAEGLGPSPGAFQQTAPILNYRTPNLLLTTRKAMVSGGK